MYKKVLLILVSCLFAQQCIAGISYRYSPIGGHLSFVSSNLGGVSARNNFAKDANEGREDLEEDLNERTLEIPRSKEDPGRKFTSFLTRWTLNGLGRVQPASDSRWRRYFVQSRRSARRQG